MNKKILFVTTNFSDINDEIKTGVWLEEFSVPYLIFEATGYEITVASPKGGESPVDLSSLSCSNPDEWDKPAKFLKNTLILDEVNYKDFDAIYIPGGHGPMFDLAYNEKLNEIVEYLYANDKIISAVCHGIAGLLGAKDSCGNSILKNKFVTAFTNKEEQIVKMGEFMPFSLEDSIKELGANFIAAKPWSEHTEISCNIVTGQNQKSAQLTAESVISLL